MLTIKQIAEIQAEAYRQIAGETDLVFDVAAENGQMFHNVKHMRWFHEAVCAEIAANDAR